MTFQDRRIEDEGSKFNSWITIARNAIWVVGLVVVVAIKLTSIDNVNVSQEEKIARIQEENKVIKATIESINNKQVDQLVMLTRLLTIVEQANRKEDPSDKKGKK